MIWLVVGLVIGTVAATLVHRRGTTVEPEPAEMVVPEPHTVVETTEAERLAAVVQVLPTGVMIVDLDGQITYRNAVAAEYGSGRHGDAIVDGKVRDMTEQALRGRSVEERVDLWGPPRRFVELRAHPIVETGATIPGSVVVMLVDRTEEHRTEVVRRDFVANVSHELKTPVGAIGVLAETLADAEDPEVVARLAGRLQREALRLGATIDDLLALSAIEADEAGPALPVRIGTVVDAAVDRARPVAERRGVGIEVDHGTDVSVPGDETQLVSAVANLVENAAKYSEADTTIRIQTELVDDEVRLAVADEGRGIPERDLERIFERFYRVDAARSRDTGGTGLGLSIVRNIVQRHGGRVTVQSVEGEGSVFTVHLPPVAGDPSSPRPVDDGPITIGGA